MIRIMRRNGNRLKMRELIMLEMGWLVEERAYLTAYSQASQDLSLSH
jgi:hypothetical protein